MAWITVDETDSYAVYDTWYEACDDDWYEDCYDYSDEDEDWESELSWYEDWRKKWV